jgi:hypothetical protein
VYLFSGSQCLEEIFCARGIARIQVEYGDFGSDLVDKVLVFFSLCDGQSLLQAEAIETQGLDPSQTREVMITGEKAALFETGCEGSFIACGDGAQDTHGLF